MDEHLSEYKMQQRSSGTSSLRNVQYLPRHRLREETPTYSSSKAKILSDFKTSKLHVRIRISSALQEENINALQHCDAFLHLDFPLGLKLLALDQRSRTDLQISILRLTSLHAISTDWSLSISKLRSQRYQNARASALAVRYPGQPAGLGRGVPENLTCSTIHDEYWYLIIKPYCFSPADT